MAKKQITEKTIRELIAKQLNISSEKVKDESSLVEDLGADSLDVVEMLMTLEEECGISIPDEEVENIKTVGQVVKLISKK